MNEMKEMNEVVLFFVVLFFVVSLSSAACKAASTKAHSLVRTDIIAHCIGMECAVQKQFLLFG